MKGWIAIVIVALIGSAVAQPAATKSKTKTKQKQPKQPPAPAPAPAPAPEATPAPPPPPPPPEPTPPPVAEPPPPAPAPALKLTPMPTPGKTLAMRKPHDGFVDRMDCSACHTPDGWDLAGTAGKSGFDHDKTGFPLRAAHAQTDCGGCHTSSAKPATSCEGCHKDPHAGRNNGPCAECHTATAWADTTALDQHRRTRMPLTGRHATLDCVACHKRQGARQWSDLPRDCYGCHSDDYHGGTHPVHDGRPDAAGNPMPVVSRECGLCHQTSAWTPATCSMGITPCPTATSARGLVAPAGHDLRFALTTGSHRTASCASCHTDVRRPQLVRCDGCHQDVALRQQHAGKAMPHGASACLRCHPRGAGR